MNCRWRDMPNSTDARGWRRVECVRCGRRLNPTPHHHDKIFANCKSLPLKWEWGHWLTLWLGVFGVSKAGVNWLRYRLGLVKPCGCGERAAKLNTIGERFAAMFTSSRPPR